ncbi:MAG: hypothetical protein ACI9OJ_001661 [Myxococcota bacterium]
MCAVLGVGCNNPDSSLKEFGKGADVGAASDAVAVPVDGESDALTLTDATETNTAGGILDALADTTADVGADVSPVSFCQPVGTVPWSTECAAPTSTVLSVGPEVSAVAVGTGSSGSLVAWASSGSVQARAFDLDGEVSSGELFVGGKPTAVSAIEVVATGQGYRLFWDHTDNGIWTCEVVGEVPSAPVQLLESGRLGRGIALGSAGFRLTAERDDTSVDPVQTLHLMVRADINGVLQGVHFLQNNSNVSYLQLHGGDVLLHIPFQRLDGGISYFLTELTVPGCGLPIDSGVVPAAPLVASTLTANRLMWVSRADGECGEGRVTFVNPLTEDVDHHDLPFVPDESSLLMSATGTDADAAVLLGVMDDYFVATRIQSVKQFVSVGKVLAPADSVGTYRADVTATGWLIAWLSSDGKRLTATHACPPPEPIVR